MILLSSAYLPNIQYMSKILSNETVWIDTCENFQKQTFRSRAIINSPHGQLPLTIPVQSGAASECPIKEVKISDHGNWRHRHWNAIKSTYGKSAFFEYLAPEIEPFFAKRYQWLLDFNCQLLDTIIRLCQISVDIHLTDHYISFDELKRLNMIDCRDMIRPKNPIPDPNFQPYPYYQTLSENGFIPNLSIIDLLFECGYETESILSKCHVNPHSQKNKTSIY